MKIPKTAILLYLLAIIVAVLFLVFLLRGINNSKISNIPNPSPTPQVNRFKVISVNPSNESIKVMDKIVINFSHPVDNLSLGLEIHPKTNIVPYFDQLQTTLIIQPSDIWEFNTSYMLVLKSTTTSTNGKHLDKDYVYYFKTLPIRGD